MAACVFVFCTLQAVLAEVDGRVSTRSPRRLVTRNAMNYYGLPIAYGARMRAVPGVRRVAAARMFAGFLTSRKEGRSDVSSTADWTTFFHNMAVDAEPYFAMSPELRVPEEQFREFMNDLRGCVIGRKLADKFAWKLGDRFFLQSAIAGLRKRSGPFEFVVRALMEPDLAKYPGTPADGMLFHLQYLDDALPHASGWTETYLVEIDEPTRAGEVSAAIDALFENATAQTISEPESVYTADLVSQAGDLSTLLNGIGLAVCFTMLLVTANTMSMAVRERRTEIAVLKALGLTSMQVMGFVVAESLIVGILGGSLGVGATYAGLSILNHTPGMALPGLATLELRPPVAWVGAGVAVVLGFAAGLLPAFSAYRATVAESLRTI
jgi:putative ABC transport system permease protein